MGRHKETQERRTNPWVEAEQKEEEPSAKGRGRSSASSPDAGAHI